MAITARAGRGVSVRKYAMASSAPLKTLRRTVYLSPLRPQTRFLSRGLWFMASPYAFVTLLTSDSYLPGALTLAAALKDIHPSPPVLPEVDFQTVCLVTPETVDISSIKLLRKAFDLVVGVEIIEEDNERGLQLLGEYPMWLTFPITRSAIRTTLRSLAATYSESVICPQSEQLFCPSQLLVALLVITPSHSMHPSPLFLFSSKYVPSNTRSSQVAPIFLRSSRNFIFSVSLSFQKLSFWMPMFFQFVHSLTFFLFLMIFRRYQMWAGLTYSIPDSWSCPLGRTSLLSS
jgi:hypothetical protein